MDRPARDWTGAEPGRHRAYYSANATPSGRPAQTLAISIQLWHPQRNRRDAKSVARQNHNQSCRRAGCRLQVESCRLASNALGQIAACNPQLATVATCNLQLRRGRRTIWIIAVQRTNRGRGAHSDHRSVTDSQVAETGLSLHCNRADYSQAAMRISGCQAASAVIHRADRLRAGRADTEPPQKYAPATTAPP